MTWATWQGPASRNLCRQPFTPASAPPGQHLAAIFGGHSSTETMGTLSLQYAWLECTLHGIDLLANCLSTGRRAEIANLLAPSTALGGADYRGGQCHWQPHELCSLHKTSPADNFYHPLAGVTPDVVGLTKHPPRKIAIVGFGRKWALTLCVFNRAGLGSCRSGTHILTQSCKQVIHRRRKIFLASVEIVLYAP